MHAREHAFSVFTQGEWHMDLSVRAGAIETVASRRVQDGVWPPKDSDQPQQVDKNNYHDALASSS